MVFEVARSVSSAYVAINNDHLFFHSKTAYQPSFQPQHLA